MRNPLARLFGANPEVPARNPTDDAWFSSSPLAASNIVSASTVVQIPEAYDCLQVLAQTIAALPLITYRRVGDGGKKRFDRHPIAKLLRSRPSAEHSAYEFRHQMTWDLCLHRNAFAEIILGRGGQVAELIRLDPGLIWVVKGGDGYVFEVRDGTRRRRIDPDRVFHLRAPPLSSDNILGRSIIEDGARTFGRALELQDYAAKFFENDATPGGVVTIPGKLTPEQAVEFKKKWQGQFTGANRHKTAVLDNGSDYKRGEAQNDKAQFVETYRECALQICRLWRMPPHKVGILDKATFSNIEQQSLEFVTDTLLPWLVAWEQGISRQLIGNDDEYFAEHNVSGLLRGDIAARYNAYAIGRQWGWLSADDIRSLENMNPLPDGDGQVYLQPLNMGPAGIPTAQRAAFEAVIARELNSYITQRRLIEAKAKEIDQ